MGSLGSALAQTAYKMLVGNKGEDSTDGPQPSGPQMFSTWEECLDIYSRMHMAICRRQKRLLWKLPLTIQTTSITLKTVEKSSSMSIMTNQSHLDCP